MLRVRVEINSQILVLKRIPGPVKLPNHKTEPRTKSLSGLDDSRCYGLND